MRTNAVLTALMGLAALASAGQTDEMRRFDLKLLNPLNWPDWPDVEDIPGLEGLSAEEIFRIQFGPGFHPIESPIREMFPDPVMCKNEYGTLFKIGELEKHFEIKRSRKCLASGEWSKPTHLCPLADDEVSVLRDETQCWSQCAVGRAFRMNPQCKGWCTCDWRHAADEEDSFLGIVEEDTPATADKGPLGSVPYVRGSLRRRVGGLPVGLLLHCATTICDGDWSCTRDCVRKHTGVTLPRNKWSCLDTLDSCMQWTCGAFCRDGKAGSDDCLKCSLSHCEPSLEKCIFGPMFDTRRRVGEDTLAPPPHWNVDGSRPPHFKLPEKWRKFHLAAMADRPAEKEEPADSEQEEPSPSVGGPDRRRLTGQCTSEQNQRGLAWLSIDLDTMEPMPEDATPMEHKCGWELYRLSVPIPVVWTDAQAKQIMEHCVANEMYIDDGCASCFGELAVCNRNSCPLQCWLGPDTVECRHCLGGRCMDDFDACAYGTN